MFSLTLSSTFNLGCLASTCLDVPLLRSTALMNPHEVWIEDALYKALVSKLSMWKFSLNSLLFGGSLSQNDYFSNSYVNSTVNF